MYDYLKDLQSALHNHSSTEAAVGFNQRYCDSMMLIPTLQVLVWDNYRCMAAGEAD